jgi:hypothetical protein
MGDLGPSYAPAALCPRKGIATSLDRLRTFWFKPTSLVWLVAIDGAFERSLPLTISPQTLALTRAEASRRAVASRLPPLPRMRDSVHCREGYRTSMNASCQHTPLGYPWGNTGSGQYLTGFSQTVIYKRDIVSRWLLLPIPEIVKSVKKRFRSLPTTLRAIRNQVFGEILRDRNPSLARMTATKVLLQSSVHMQYVCATIFISCVLSGLVAAHLMHWPKGIIEAIAEWRARASCS